MNCLNCNFVSEIIRQSQTRMSFLCIFDRCYLLLHFHSCNIARIAFFTPAFSVSPFWAENVGSGTPLIAYTVLRTDPRLKVQRAAGKGNEGMKKKTAGRKAGYTLTMFGMYRHQCFFSFLEEQKSWTLTTVSQLKIDVTSRLTSPSVDRCSEFFSVSPRD